MLGDEWRWLGLIISGTTLLLSGLDGLPSANAEMIRVAVASNAKPLLSALAADFQADTGHIVQLSAGATGKLTTQIQRGAPFDAFFAADAARPTRLVDEGYAIPGTRFTYALGELVLWRPSRMADSAQQPATSHVLTHAVTPAMLNEWLRAPEVRHVAIANPDLAPYGAAAIQVLTRGGLAESLAEKLVRGENVAQAYQFVATGNAEVGLVARSLMIASADPREWWLIPADWYAPITQQAVRLADRPAVRAFMTYVQSDAGRAIVQQHGYRLP